jgi:hypothetical protein
MKYRPHPQTSFGGTFTFIPTEKNSPTSDLQTGQSPREFPFTDEIDIQCSKSADKYIYKLDLNVLFVPYFLK